MSKNLKQERRQRRHARIRYKISGTLDRPRLSVFKSNKQIYAQIIDDEKSVTMTCADSMKMTEKKMTEKAELVATEIALKAKKIGVDSVVFDRGGFEYTGVIKLFADSARKAGLIF